MPTPAVNDYTEWEQISESERVRPSAAALSSWYKTNRDESLG